jgi:hypothetical protein
MRIVTLVCLLVACSGGDLTLPSSAESLTLKRLSGDGQRAPAGAPLQEPLVVQVLDADSTPVRGATVEFGFLGDPPGAVIDPPLVTTGDDGRAETFARLGTVHGEQLIIARVAGTASPDLSAHFVAIALRSGGGGGGDDDDDEEDD